MANSAESIRHRAQRLETRLTVDQKELIERAAAVQGRSVSDFVASTLQDAAKKIIEDHFSWTLTRDQQKVFVEALLNPPEPNEALRAAHRRYRQYREVVSR